MPEEEKNIEATEYDIVRSRSGIMNIYSAERKLRWCGYVLLAASLTAPVLLLLPDRVVETYLDGTPLSTPLTLAGMAFLGVTLVLASVPGLVWISVVSQDTADASRDKAWRLAGMEGIFGWFAFGWGAPLVFIALGAAASGFLGVDFIESLGDRGITPYSGEATLSLPVAYLSATTFVLGFSVVYLAAYISRSDSD